MKYRSFNLLFGAIAVIVAAFLWAVVGYGAARPEWFPADPHGSLVAFAILGTLFTVAAIALCAFEIPE